ncbi:MAG: NADH-quinone oxidoreductase subunit L [Hymenobacteraceae bacterium]|nr:NADH-quinone oxidoreductase subunit L [Hymenobacteraceae bacterium]
MLVLIPFLPFIGFLLNGLGHRILPKGVAGLVGCATVLAAFGLSVALWAGFPVNGAPQTVVLFDWISVGKLQIPFAYQLDQLSLTMLLLVTGVGSLIHIYSVGYMHDDPGFARFMAYLNLFVFAMLLLVLGANYGVMFVGWEGVGLCSYLLIGFWNRNQNYNDAAKKAFIVNRIGDLGFLLGIFLMFQQFGSITFTEVNAQAALLPAGAGVMVAITLLLFVGAMGKSAQLPLFTWLPDAMAGPTPVSALIHAATMVTAGIYMVIRSGALYALAPFTLEVVAWTGLLTALVGAGIALAQTDIKKVLAYSTVSQLGLMFLGLGVLGFSSALFHVLTHAFFKALLFLGAGSVIHAYHHEQDIRRMGGLRKHLPITFATFLIGTIAIAGIPPFAGFFSKDELLAHVFEHSKLMWGLGLLVSLATSFYMFRLLFLVFFGEFRGTDEQKHHLHESPLTITGPLMILAVLAAVGGALGIPHILGGHPVLADWLRPVLALPMKLAATWAPTHELSGSLELTLMGVSPAVAFVGLGVAYVRYVSGARVPAEDGQPVNALTNLSRRKFYVDELYDSIIVRPIMALSRGLYTFVEQKIVDPLVNGVGSGVLGFGRNLRLVQGGSVGAYVLLMVVGIVLILALNFYSYAR